jgi:carbamoyltransferase
MKKILGISAFYHDSAAALSIGGQIAAAAQEERFTREKNTAVFPVNAIRYCLEFAGLALDDLDAIVFYDKPVLKFERLLETYYAFAPKGIASFLSSMPVWTSEKLFMKKAIYSGLKEIGPYKREKLSLQFTEHHLSHAASAFYTSPFGSSAILTIDGVGEWCTASIGIGDKDGIRILKEMSFPHSVGLLYSAFTYYLGFRVNSGEYKLMGLAPYGNPEGSDTLRFESIIREHLVDIRQDGSIWLDQEYFTYPTGLKMLDDAQWEKLFGIPKRDPESAIEQKHCDLALAVQRVTEDIVLKMAAEAKKLSGSDKLCLAGGVALNCVANGKLQKSGIFSDIYIQPAAGDAGGAIGAALASDYMFFNEPWHNDPGKDKMQGSYLGPEFTDVEIENMCADNHAVYHKQNDFDEVARLTANHLSDGKIVGWFRGRMEFGPRALGNRSILAYAGIDGMQDKINKSIKYREGFRPFAPALLREDVKNYFALDADSPYMLLVAPIKEAFRKALPAAYNSLDLWQKLKTERSAFQAVTHVDFSARIQSVDDERNPAFYKLIQEVKKITGHGMLVNTSFNVRSEPVVCTPEEAYRCFMNTGMDYLVINNFIFDKKEQDKAYTNRPAKPGKSLFNTISPEKSVYTIAIAFTILYFLFQKEWMFNTGLAVGFASVGLPFLNRYIDFAWMKLAYVLNLFMPKIILSLIFYLVLLPVALLSRIFSKKDPLMLKNKHASTFRDREKKFSKEDFSRMW